MNFYGWQSSSTGFGMKMLEKYGYNKGEGLGEQKQGIISSIKAKKKTRFDDEKEQMMQSESQKGDAWFTRDVQKEDDKPVSLCLTKQRDTSVGPS